MPLGRLQQVVLVVIAVALAIGLLFMRGGIQSETPMEQLARRSVEPEVALTNGKPTLIEFYADWCQVCREMAPAMLELERSTQNRLDVVLVNVDNPRWQDLVNRYDVNGIPQLNLFSADGQPRGKSIGLRKPGGTKSHQCSTDE
jgi:thiol:disulfide interchange protein